MRETELLPPRERSKLTPELKGKEVEDGRAAMAVWKVGMGPEATELMLLTRE